MGSLYLNKLNSEQRRHCGKDGPENFAGLTSHAIERSRITTSVLHE